MFHFGTEQHSTRQQGGGIKKKFLKKDTDHKESIKIAQSPRHCIKQEERLNEPGPGRSTGRGVSVEVSKDTTAEMF